MKMFLLRGNTPEIESYTNCFADYVFISRVLMLKSKGNTENMDQRPAQANYPQLPRRWLSANINQSIIIFCHQLNVTKLSSWCFFIHGFILLSFQLICFDSAHPNSENQNVTASTKLMLLKNWVNFFFIFNCD